jgi:hypothetical protein
MSVIDSQLSETPWETEEEADWQESPVEAVFAEGSHSDSEADGRRYGGAVKAGPALAASVANIAEREYRRWQPHMKERDPAATPILQEYYRLGVAKNVSPSQLQSESWQKAHPWSAVFVSYVMKKAGAGDAFAYSPAHQSYIRSARRNRLTVNTGNPFWAFRITDIAPQVGDLVCTARGDSGATYDNISDPQSRKTHCDIVTAVRPGQIRVIGGNVDHRVGAKPLRTHPDGRLRIDGKQSGYFAVIRCNDAAVTSTREAHDEGALKIDGGVWPSAAEEADFERASISEAAFETELAERYSGDEWNADTAVEDSELTDEEPRFGQAEFDEYDEDHAEEATIHNSFVVESEFSDESVEDEGGDPELLAELMQMGYAAADEFDSLSEDFTDDSAFEEFGGAEHKHIGDTVARGATISIMYGSPPQPLSFGDVVALAGDYFGDFYELKNLAKTSGGPIELAYARWHCLGLKGSVPMPAAGDANKPARKRVINRYFKLASRNLTHFSAGGTAVPAYMKAHADALVDAFDAGQSGDKAIWQRALAKEAFAEHYLTDMFSAGHVRTPRAAIKQWYEQQMPGNTEAIVNYMARFLEQRVPGQRGVAPNTVWYIGWIKAKLWGSEILADSIKRIGGEAIDAFALGDIVSLALHDYDNKGLDVVSRADARGRKVAGGYRWTAVGDGHLGVNAKPGMRRQEAVFTTEMATAAVAASLRDLQQVRDIGAKLGNQNMTSSQRASSIRKGIDTPFAATLLIPREDLASHRNVPLNSTTSRPVPLDWRWGRLGTVTRKAVDDTVRYRLSKEINEVIPDIDDTSNETHLGVTIRVTGIKAALGAFAKHLEDQGIRALEDAVGKPAR